MGEHQPMSGFLRSFPTRILFQTTCEYCGTLFISSEELIDKLEITHRATCKKPVAASTQKAA